MSRHPLPPGPRGSWLLGISPLKYGRPLEALLDWSRQYGDVVSWRTMHIRVFLFNHPDDIETILVTRSHCFMKGRGLQANRQLFGNGLLTSEGDFWLRQRRLIQPAFHRERVTSYGPAMVARATLMLDQWKDGEARDVHRDLMRLTLEIAAETLFGVGVEHDADRVSEALDILMTANTSTRRLLPLARHLPTAANRQYAWAVGELDRIVYGIIAQRRAQGGAGAEEITSGTRTLKDDMLSRLLRTQDDDGKRMTDKQLRDECITLLLAGHETTALTLSWTAYLLAQHPIVQDKFHAELDAVLAGRPPKPEDLLHLPYTESILRESMRLYPPAWLMPRLAVEDCEIHGYHIPKGGSVLVSQFIAHRDPRYFPDAESFTPDRWTEAFARSLPRFAYFPFGGGHRLCIGNNFALLEATLLLAVLGQRFRLGLASSAPVERQPSITLRPKDGVRLTISRRL